MHATSEESHCVITKGKMCYHHWFCWIQNAYSCQIVTVKSLIIVLIHHSFMKAIDRFILCFFVVRFKILPNKVQTVHTINFCLVCINLTHV